MKRIMLMLLLTGCASKHNDPFAPAPPAPPTCAEENAQLAHDLKAYRDRPFHDWWWFGHRYVAYLCDAGGCPERRGAD